MNLRLNNARFQGVIEAVKEAGRYAVFYGVSVFVSVLLSKVSAMSQNDMFNIVLTLGLRALDKYLHIKGKKEMIGKNYQPKGLLPF